MMEPPPPPEVAAVPPDFDEGGFRPHRGILIFALGLAGCAFLFVFGAIAWAMGNRDLAEMEEGLRDPRGYGPTAAGRFFGMASVVVANVLLLAALACLLS